MMELPPQPNVADFIDRNGNPMLVAYGEAMRAWERVCALVVGAEKQAPRERET